MSRPNPSPATAPPRSSRPLEPTDVVLCVLCGALNHKTNAECWICRWHGAFNVDAREITLAWRRLECVYEEVRLEHVTSRRRRLLGDFGSPLRTNVLRSLLARLRRRA